MGEQQITEYQAENESLRIKIKQTETEKEDLDKRAKVIDDMSQMMQNKIDSLTQSANDLFSDIATNKEIENVVNRKLLDKNCALHEKLKHFQPIKESLDGKEMEYQ